MVWTIALSYNGHILKVTHLDVGQGDSAFVEFPGGDNILIDGGAWSTRFDTGERVIQPLLQHKGVDKLNLVVSTHPHNDHVGGLICVAKNFQIDEVITGSYGAMTPAYDKLYAQLDRNRVKHGDACVGIIHEDEGIKVEVVAPEKANISRDQYSQMNRNSVVLKVTYGGVSFLFTGDIDDEAEQLLIDSGKNIKATVLKVPHQGSKTSSSWEFLKTVQPHIGVISVGRRNPFNHPAPVILERYKALGIEVYRTDLQGAITVITDGRRGWVKIMKK